MEIQQMVTSFESNLVQIVMQYTCNLALWQAYKHMIFFLILIS